MRRKDFSEWPCSVARTAELIGDGWTPLILRDSVAGIDTFDAFQKNLGVSRNTLTQRLNKLVETGMMTQVAYSERPKRFRYKLTEMGKDFVPVLLAMTAWGDKWLFDGSAPYLVHHQTCGHDTHANVTCSVCNQPMLYENTTKRRSVVDQEG